MTKQQILKKTEKFARGLMKDVKEPAHSFDHVLRVRKWAVKLAKLEKVDQFKIQMVALLHDIGRGRENFKKGLAHAEMSAILARPFIDKFKEINPQDKNDIIVSVARHSKGREADSRLTQVFQDADRLDAIGIVGIVRVISFYHRLKICNSPKSFIVKKLDRDEIDNAMKKGKELFDDIVGSVTYNYNAYFSMNTKSGKKLSKPLIKEMDDFLKKLKMKIL